MGFRVEGLELSTTKGLIITNATLGVPYLLLSYNVPQSPILIIKAQILLVYVASGV